MGAPYIYDVRLQRVKSRLYLRTTQHFIQEIGLKKGEVRESEHIILALGIILMLSGCPKDLDVVCRNYNPCYNYSIQLYKINAMFFFTYVPCILIIIFLTIVTLARLRQCAP